MKALGSACLPPAAFLAVFTLAGCSTGPGSTPPAPAPASATASLAAPDAPRDRVLVEDLARRLIVAIRDKDDATLRSLAGSRIAGWPDALPLVAAEHREHYRQNAGDGAVDLSPSETLLDGDFAAVRCTGSDVLGRRCLVLFFSREPEGWRNHSLRASTTDIPLSRHLDALKQQISRAAPSPTR